MPRPLWTPPAATAPQWPPGNIRPLRHRCCKGRYVAFTAPSTTLSRYLPVLRPEGQRMQWQRRRRRCIHRFIQRRIVVNSDISWRRSYSHHHNQSSSPTSLGEIPRVMSTMGFSRKLLSFGNSESDVTHRILPSALQWYHPWDFPMGKMTGCYKSWLL